ncbi:pyridoxamine 5'-phosphate oxidase family protein [Halomonas sp. M5N1S15]|nr:pyridoxamine 5'-phosphate oxidase family protein [Halomonas alkalisoli]MCE9682658.1 pyridoxamine 5'-phosphate oxidase family protein [Halomonas alkalisoli]
MITSLQPRPQHPVKHHGEEADQRIGSDAIRLPAPARGEPSAAAGRCSSLDDPAVRRIVESADTFFIASRAASPLEGGSAGIDASHRGGRPGFLDTNDDGSLSFPDFSGNRMFNTLGNIESDGRVALFVPDFETAEAAGLKPSYNCRSGNAALAPRGCSREACITRASRWSARPMTMC